MFEFAGCAHAVADEFGGPEFHGVAPYCGRDVDFSDDFGPYVDDFGADLWESVWGEFLSEVEDLSGEVLFLFPGEHVGFLSCDLWLGFDVAVDDWQVIDCELRGGLSASFGVDFRSGLSASRCGLLA